MGGLMAITTTIFSNAYSAQATFLRNSAFVKMLYTISKKPAQNTNNVKPQDTSINATELLPDQEAQS